RWAAGGPSAPTARAPRPAVLGNGAAWVRLTLPCGVGSVASRHWGRWLGNRFGSVGFVVFAWCVPKLCSVQGRLAGRTLQDNRSVGSALLRKGVGSVLLQCPGPCLQAFGKARQLVGIECFQGMEQWLGPAGHELTHQVLVLCGQ